MTSFSNNANFSNPMAQTLMQRLQTNPPNNSRNNVACKSLEEILLDALSIASSDSDTELSSKKSHLSKEEAKLEGEIIRIILSGNIDSLKPNSGDAVAFGEHHVCVGFHQDKESDYRVWEWHGHIVMFDEENGYEPEYIYGNYFERLRRSDHFGAHEEVEEQEVEEKNENSRNLGLRELIDDGHSHGARILHRNMCVGSQRYKSFVLGRYKQRDDEN